MEIAQEEIFGPVLSIIAYDNEDEAVRIANDSIYGLAGGVWGGTPERALQVSRGACAPGKSTSTAAASITSRRLAVTRSRDIGSELGPHALDEFFQLKPIQR